MRKYIGFIAFGVFLITMNVALAVWDATIPNGNEAKSLGDDRIRELKTDVQTSLDYEGSFPGSDTSNPRFIYTPSTGTTALRPTGNAAPSGRLYINLSSGTLEMSQGNGNWNALDVVGSSTITGVDLAVSVAGDGLIGGGGSPLAVNYDDSLFGITTDSITIDANSIGSTQIADTVTIPTLAVTTQTWGGFGVLPILQVVQFNTDTSSSTLSTSFIVTTLKATITPKSSSSKILVMITGSASQASGDSGYVTIGRAGTNLGGTFGMNGLVSNNNYTISMIYLDSPATTSSREYSAMIRTNGGAATTFFPYGPSANVAQANITLMEIGL